MPRARYKSLVDRFAVDIRSGALPPGTRLPTHRKLAQQHGLALVTASRVYAELEIMGLVSGEKGRGTFVRETRVPRGHGIDQAPNPAGTQDLNFNSPALPGQADMLREGLRNLAASGDFEALLHYQPHAGRNHERALVAQYLEARGLKTSAEQVVITSGAQHGLATSILAMLNPGDAVLADALIYPGFKAVVEMHKLEILPVSLTESGPNLDEMEALCQQRKVRALYAMPTLHNPLGWVLSLEQRRRLVDIARRHELIIIEDAAYAFHEAAPPPPLAALAPERTLYVSGFSKNIATGLRVGYIVSPKLWIPRLERIIRATTWNTPALMTALVCRWIEDGTLAELEQAKRQDASARQTLARNIFHDWHCISHEASSFLWLQLPEDVRSEQVVSALLSRQIAVATAEPFATTTHIPNAIRMALGSVDFEQLDPALKTVKQVIDDLSVGVI